MEVKFYLDAIKFYGLAILYILIVVGSIYGLFVNEISIFKFTLSGWKKNLLCLSGLCIIAVISTYPVLISVYRAFSNNGN